MRYYYIFTTYLLNWLKFKKLIIPRTDSDPKELELSIADEKQYGKQYNQFEKVQQLLKKLNI